MNLETRFQMLIKVSKYADSEFRIKKNTNFNIYCCCFHKVNKFQK